MDLMMTLPKPLAELAWNEIREFEKEKGMTFITTAERVGMEKGLAEGLAKGRQEGIEKGIEKGIEEGLLEGIEALLETRFGAAGLALLPEIRDAQNAGMLRQIMASLKHADSPEVVRRVWAKH